LSVIENAVSNDNLYLILSSRPQTVSFDPGIDALPKKLNKEFEYLSMIVIYPDVMDHDTGQLTEFGATSMQENFEKIIRVKDKITGIFKKEDD
jgi:hypothetical protein